ncbi:SDR family NAD(P)-dependent oxidoreductase [Paenibacillus thiaminolyticus]|uniref:SDR family NAD(P)-dependent oxidoreductase n=1 Tax=Paenibacillus thiaminolyticus TaxID=49283 RepID=A0AAP9E024_PANTH|nr:SDR family NAD(P)-dependent oxidoreductase [Paenibacillus thiaminolyticus]QDM45616.1 SDR family NAD(P)-dependent oxidoreductase [Paenibacillus thiaminolyticus]
MFAHISGEGFDRVGAVNFKGVFLGMKNVLKVMEEQGWGTINNTASTLGLKPEHSVAA